MKKGFWKILIVFAAALMLVTLGSAQTLYEDFERSSPLDDYYLWKDSQYHSIVQSPVLNGENALRIDASDGDFNGMGETDDLQHPSAGDTFNASIYLENSQSGRYRISYGVQSEEFNPSGYVVWFDVEDSKFTFNDRSGGSDNAVDSESVSYSSYTGEWLTVQIDWGSGGTHTHTLYDSSGNQIAEVSGSSSSITSGGIGFVANSKGGDITAYYDFYVDSDYTTSNTSPNITIHEPDNTLYDSNVSYNISVDSENDDISDESFSCDIKENNNLINTVNGDGEEQFTGNFTPETEGEDLEFKVECSDSEKSVTATSLFSYDSTPPEMTVNDPEKDVYEKTSVPINFSAEDNITNVENCWYEIDGEETNYSCGDKVIESFEEIGNHTIIMKAEDGAGNIGEEQLEIETFFENKIEVEDIETGYGIEDFEANFYNEENGDFLFKKENNETYVKFNTSNVIETSVLEIEIAAEGYNIWTETYEIDKKFELDIVAELDSVGITVDVFDEQTEARINEPINILFKNETKTEEYAYGQKLIDHSSSNFETNDPSNAFDGDLETNYWVGNPDDGSWEILGKIAIKPGDNTIYVECGSSTYKFCGNWEIKKDNGEWNEIISESDFDGTNQVSKTIENGEDYTGHIKGSHSYSSDSDANAKIYEVYANNYTNPNFEYENAPVTGDTTITAQDIDKEYMARNYFVTIDPYSSVSLDTFLLDQAEGTFSQIEVYDRAGQFVENAEVTVQRSFGGNWKTVDQKETGSDGSTSFFGQPGIQYRVLVQHPEYVAVDATFDPANYQYDPLELVLAEDDGLEFFNMWETISTKIMPDNQTIYSEETDLEFNIYDSDNELQAFSFKLLDEENETIEQVSEMDSPSGGTLNITANLTDYEDQDIEAVGEFIKNQTTYKYSRNYKVISRWEEGEYSLSKTINDLGEEMKAVPKAMIAILLPLFFGVGMGRRWNKTGGGLIILIMLGIFAAAEWINPSIFTITLIAGFGALMWR